MKNLVTTKYLIYSQKKSALESSKHFYNMKNAASKQNNMTTICREHQNKHKPYIPTHDLRLINLFDICNKEVTI